MPTTTPTADAEPPTPSADDCPRHVPVLRTYNRTASDGIRSEVTERGYANDYGPMQDTDAMQEDPPADAWTVLYVDLDGYRDTPEGRRKALKSLADRIGREVTGGVDHVSLSGYGLPEDMARLDVCPAGSDRVTPEDGEEDAAIQVEAHVHVPAAVADALMAALEGGR